MIWIISFVMNRSIISLKMSVLTAIFSTPIYRFINIMSLTGYKGIVNPLNIRYENFLDL